jgi:ElaB/YqjD/DUF883 family membrane-anchored ribosome-binding protein
MTCPWIHWPGLPSVLSTVNTFNAMSDLVADADDVILRIGESADPELQMLKERLRGLIDAIRQRARRRIRRENAAHSQPRGVPTTGVRAAQIIEITVGVTVAMLLYRAIFGREA